MRVIDKIGSELHRTMSRARSRLRFEVDREEQGLARLEAARASAGDGRDGLCGRAHCRVVSRVSTGCVPHSSAVGDGVSETLDAVAAYANVGYSDSGVAWSAQCRFCCRECYRNCSCCSGVSTSSLARGAFPPILLIKALGLHEWGEWANKLNKWPRWGRGSAIARTSSSCARVQCARATSSSRPCVHEGGTSPVTRPHIIECEGRNALSSSDAPDSRRRPT